MEINILHIVWGAGFFFVTHKLYSQYIVPKTKEIDPIELDDMGLLMSDVSLGGGYWPNGMRAVPVR